MTKIVWMYIIDMNTNITCIYEIRYMNKRCNAQHFFSLLPCTTRFNSNSRVKSQKDTIVPHYSLNNWNQKCPPSCTSSGCILQLCKSLINIGLFVKKLCLQDIWTD